MQRVVMVNPNWEKGFIDKIVQRKDLKQVITSLLRMHEVDYE